MATQITEDEYVEAQDSSQGWCTHCRHFTNDFAEPDASGYTCDECEQPTVYGAEQALLLGLITF